jgi:hypothetical protein
MAVFPKVREQHVAVFGEAGSGKTVLLSSFFGLSQEPSSASESWDLVADDPAQGARLFKFYAGLRDFATVPMTTRRRATTYSFLVKIKGAGGTKPTKAHPFDVLRLVWHDYPGEWFEEAPDSPEEAKRRIDIFRRLLRSDVAVLLVDGQKLLDHQGEEERYLKTLFTNFRQGVLRLKDDLLDGEGRLAEFPRIWIIARSKADLAPDQDVEAFHSLVMFKAEEEIAQLRETLKEFVVAPEALSLGEDFMLLSSAKFELSATGGAPVAIDITKRVGVDLILPIASMLPLERRVQWQEKMKLPMRVLDTMADNAESLAKVLVGARGGVVDKALSKLPRIGLLQPKFVVPAVSMAVQMAASELKRINEEAKADQDHLTAALAQFKLDLEQGVTDGRLVKAK